MFADLQELQARCKEKAEKLSVVLEIKGIAMVDLCNVAIKDVTGQN